MSALDALGNELGQQNQQPSAPAAPPKAAPQAPAPTPAPASASATQGAQGGGSPLPSAPTSNPDRDAVSSMYGPAWKGAMQGVYDWTNQYAKASAA